MERHGPRVFSFERIPEKSSKVSGCADCRGVPDSFGEELLPHVYSHAE